MDREGAAGPCWARLGVKSAVRRRARARCGVSAHPTATGSLGPLPRK